jgi:mannosyltransferase
MAVAQRDPGRPPASRAPSPPTARGTPPRGLVFAVPALATLLSCLLGLGERSLWRDEHATWWAASLSFGELRELTGHVDLVLAPYYAFLHLWIGVFGDSPAALRLPSARDGGGRRAGRPAGPPAGR